MSNSEPWVQCITWDDVTLWSVLTPYDLTGPDEPMGLNQVVLC